MEEALSWPFYTLLLLLISPSVHSTDTDFADLHVFTWWIRDSQLCWVLDWFKEVSFFPENAEKKIILPISGSLQTSGYLFKFSFICFIFLKLTITVWPANLTISSLNLHRAPPYHSFWGSCQRIAESLLLRHGFNHWTAVGMGLRKWLFAKEYM